MQLTFHRYARPKNTDNYNTPFSRLVGVLVVLFRRNGIYIRLEPTDYDLEKFINGT